MYGKDWLSHALHEARIYLFSASPDQREFWMKTIRALEHRLGCK